MIKLDLITAQQYWEDYKKESVDLKADSQQEIEVGIGRADEYLVAKTKTVAVLEENTGDDGELTPDYLASIEYSILQTATAQLTELFINNDHDFTQGSFSSSINGVSSSHQRGEFIVPDQTLALLVRAGVLDSVLISQANEACPNEVADIPGQSRGDEYLTQDQGRMIFAQLYNTTNLALTGSKNLYDMDAIVNANNSANVLHETEEGVNTNVKQELWDVNRDITDTDNKVNEALDYIIGLNAEADVASTVAQIIPPNASTIMEFDETLIGNDQPGGNVDLVNNTITVSSDVADITKLRFTVSALFKGDNNGDKTASFKVDHLDSQGVMKTAYNFTKPIEWTTIDKPVVDQINIVLADLKTPRVPIVDGDKFMLVIDSTAPDASVRLRAFAIENTTNVVGASTAEQVAYDDSVAVLKPARPTTQAALDKLGQEQTVLNFLGLGANPTEDALWVAFNERKGHLAQKTGIDIKFNTILGVCNIEIEDYVANTSMTGTGWLRRANGRKSIITCKISAGVNTNVSTSTTQLEVATATTDNAAVNLAQLNAKQSGAVINIFTWGSNTYTLTDLNNLNKDRNTIWIKEFRENTGGVNLITGTSDTRYGLALDSQYAGLLTDVSRVLTFATTSNESQLREKGLFKK